MKGEYFIVTNLGFESELAREIQEFWPFLMNTDGGSHSHPIPELRLEKGGVQLFVDDHFGLQFNLFSKLSNRVLRRIDERKVHEFYQFEKFLKEVFHKSSWSNFPISQVKIDSSQSKLGQEKRLLKIAEEVIKIQPQGFEVWIRVFQDSCVISWNTSGEHLHFRGDKPMASRAPLRSTLASFGLRFLFKEFSLSEIQSQTYYDPFCGSGTLLLEVANFKNLNTDREYPFQKWSGCPTIIKSFDQLKRFSKNDFRVKGLIGADLDLELIKKVSENFLNCAPTPKLIHQDSCEVGLGLKNLVIVTNPPYGERLKSDQSLEESLLKIWKLNSPKALLAVVPASIKLSKLEPFERTQAFSNGGLPVYWIKKISE